MKKTLLLTSLFVLIILPFTASLIMGETAPPRHATVTLHESMINNFFKAIGPVTGKGEKSGIKYTWVVEDARVNVEPGTAAFEAKVKLDAGIYKTVENAKGKVSIEYVKETNRMRVRVEEAIVKLSIKLLGKHIQIGSIDIAKYYRPTFEFAGPQPIQKEVEVELPDGTKKKIQITTKNENLVLEKDQVSVYSELVFTPMN